ncbi:MAG TPA: hypothetical protein VGR96_05195 [Acidobacteriaceae bacterium]|nr:hypothetical protein [Acidobacteriaceae bacterium]
MRTKVQSISFEQIVTSLRRLQFDVQELAGVAKPAGTDAILVKKYGAGAILARRPKTNHSEKNVPQHAALWVHHPGFLVSGEVGTLLDRGYQKFWKVTGLEIPATADSLKAVHRFSEEVRETIGEPSLYNESLGTTSDVYLYDRVKGRDLPVAERPKPAWELPPETGAK